MSQSDLILHRGARLVTREELEKVQIPPPTETWFPLAHSHVLDHTVATLEQAGFRPTRTQLALSRNDARFFGALDIESLIAPGVNLAVGIRNSCDRSLPISMCAGNRVLICDYADLPVMRTGR